jgi:hypothetical protein
MAQAPVSGGTSVSPASTTPDKRYAALLNDPVFAAIHNAFLLGASLVELKSRVQIAACNISLKPLDTITFDEKTSTFITSVLKASSSIADITLQQPNVIDAVLDNIVLKDAAQWLSADLRDHNWLTSVLRAIFQQLVTLHLKRLPDSTTAHTIYDLPDPPQNAQELSSYPYPYLYPLPPNSPFDYASIGIDIIKDSSAGASTIASFVTNFKLYDVTRRALNCLTLLFGEAEESLTPATIDCYQRRLVQAILATPPVPSSEPDCNKIPKPSADDIKTAIKTLSNLVVRLLEAWDSFLRESLYVDTKPQVTDPNAPAKDNEIEQAAYEAGRSLTALSWNVSVATAPLESALKPEQETGIGDALTRKALTLWQKVFNDRDINNVQYQIAALSTVLDGAYYRVNPDVKPPSADDPLAPLNPDLPSQAIEAVSHSLDYWQRTITRLCSANNGATIKPNGATIKPALDPSSVATPTASAARTNTPNSSVSDASSQSPLLDWNLSKTLRKELIQQAIVWQSLILCQQGLQSFTMEKVTQRILNDFMRDLEQAVRDEILKNRTLRWTSIGIIVVISAFILLLVIAALTQYQNFSLSGLVQSPFVIITAIGALITPFVTGITSRLSKLSAFFGAAGTAVEEALQRGYARMLIEFGYLNHNLAITYPLIEFFIWEEIAFDGNPVQDGYDFLVNVFWTSADFEEEFQRVARAAFGPISAFIDAQLKVTPPPKKDTGKTS